VSIDWLLTGNDAVSANTREFSRVHGPVGGLGKVLKQVGHKFSYEADAAVTAGVEHLFDRDPGLIRKLLNFTDLKVEKSLLLRATERRL
jgi:hypothetical protein